MCFNVGVWLIKNKGREIGVNFVLNPGRLSVVDYSLGWEHKMILTACVSIGMLNPAEGDTSQPQNQEFL